MALAPRIAVRDIALFERPIQFARPFRFGAVTITEAVQVFVRAEIEIEGGKTSIGASAEMLAPKWFDKRAHLSAEETAAELRRSLAIARDLYLSRQGYETPFGLHAARIGSQVAACATEDIPPLAAGFGPAEIDKAVLDAVLRASATDVFAGMSGNIAGLDARLTPDLSAGEIEAFLRDRPRLERVAVRHTVGLDDVIEGEGGVADPHETSGARYFKLKLGGDPAADAARLIRIGRELATLPYAFKVTLDANEQYADLAALAALIERLDRDGDLAPIAQRLLYIEQPMPRDITRTSPLDTLSRRDFIIDEADDSYDAFPQAKPLGYRGISSKSCKGIYKAMLNAARAAAWSGTDERFFVSGEDLTCQAGLAVQQDLALGAFIGVSHAERNGHHYVDGFNGAPVNEARAFLAAHPDLYTGGGDAVRLAIHDGDLLTGSLVTAGFASGVHPDWAALRPLDVSTTRIAQEQAV